MSLGSIGTTTASDALPAGRPLPLAGYRTPRSGGLPQPPGQRGPPQFPSSPSERSEPSTPGSSSRLRSRVFTASMAFALRDGARLSLIPLSRAHSRRGRLRLTLRTARSLPLQGLLTLGFDPARFQTEPPACYRAPWRLPVPDSHRLATTSFEPSQITSCRSLPVPVRTPGFC